MLYHGSWCSMKKTREKICHVWYRNKRWQQWKIQLNLYSGDLLRMRQNCPVNAGSLQLKTKHWGEFKGQASFSRTDSHTNHTSWKMKLVFFWRIWFLDIFSHDSGVVWSIYVLVIVDLLGEEYKDSAIGQAFACMGIACTILGPLAGWGVQVLCFKLHVYNC